MINSKLIYKCFGILGFRMDLSSASFFLCEESPGVRDGIPAERGDAEEAAPDAATDLGVQFTDRTALIGVLPTEETPLPLGVLSSADAPLKGVFSNEDDAEISFKPQTLKLPVKTKTKTRRN
jgi:hypothetical protein